MITPRFEPALPGPYTAIPHGWYCVALSKDLRSGTVKAVRYFGEELALYRSRTGQARLTTAWCPHLGAHLGHSGEVQGDELRCRFHGFRFDGEGRCVATAYGHKAPPKAVLRTFPVREQGGLVFAWYHPDGVPPSWELPSFDLQGWSSPRTSAFQLRGHPQETSENSVDLGHFTVVHGFESGRQIAPIDLDGPTMRIRHVIVASAASLGLPRWGRFEIGLDLTLSGLGVSLVHGRVAQLGLSTRQLVLPTPIDAETIELRLWSQARMNHGGRLLRAPLAWIFHQGFHHEVQQDLAIWRHKRYLHRPALAQGDGPIGAYRRWCRRFYVQEALVPTA